MEEEGFSLTQNSAARSLARYFLPSGMSACLLYLENLSSVLLFPNGERGGRKRFGKLGHFDVVVVGGGAGVCAQRQQCRKESGGESLGRMALLKGGFLKGGFARLSIKQIEAKNSTFHLKSSIFPPSSAVSAASATNLVHWSFPRAAQPTSRL